MNRSLSLLALLGACAPQNAQLTAGDFTVYLSDNSSITLRKGKLDLDAFENHTAVDCRLFEESASNEAQREELRLGGEGEGFERLKICPGDPQVSANEWPPEQEEWLDFDGFHVLSQQLEPWRGEGIITNEGDVQLAFHHTLPGGVDLRFLVTVDPDFQPRECVQNAEGTGVVYEEIDGNWLENWSAEADTDGTMIFVNSGAYQFSPRSVEDYDPSSGTSNIDQWFLPNQWLAGYAEGFFGDDRFIMRPTRFATPAAYLSVEQADASAFEVAQVSTRDLYYAEYCGDECASQAREDANTVYRNLTRAGLPESEDGDALPSYKPQVHSNAWREFDGQPSGMDGWAELHYNWVRFDAGSSFEKGGEATGQFVLVLDGTESSSRLFLRGNFEITRWKQEAWGTEFLPPVKFEENGTSLCGIPPEDVAPYL